MFSKSSRSYTLLALLLAGPVVLPASLSGQWSPISNVDAATALAPPALFATSRWRTPSTELAPKEDGTRASMTVPPAAVASAPSLVLGVASPLSAGRNALSPAPIVPLQSRARGRTHIAMMALGGAALVAGLMIGGDDGRIIALAGAVIGLTGLYRYMR